MRKILVSLTLLFAFVIVPVHAYADTISTFVLSVVTSDENTWLYGHLNIDTTTGVAEDGEFTFHLANPGGGIVPFQQVSLSGDFDNEPCPQYGCDGFRNDYLFLNDGVSFLVIQIPTTLVGYTGGPLCYGPTTRDLCQNYGAGTYFFTSDIKTESGGTFPDFEVDFPGADLQLVSTVDTPEPSTFALFGTGIIGLLGAVKRRLATQFQRIPRHSEWNKDIRNSRH